MATATPIQHQQNRHRARSEPEPAYSILHLWHLLSLDAPTVAVLWTWFIASANHLSLPFTATLSMAIAVWMLYAADRLMDARQMGTPSLHLQPNELEARHYFHHRHRARFLTGILIASIALAILLPHLEAPAIHLYLILGGLLSGYFILIHATPTAETSRKVAHRLPKEIAVGIFFAAATFIPTVARRPDLRLALLPLALLFASLCSLNCLFIYAWEHSIPHPARPAHATTRFALRHLQSITIILSAASSSLALFDHHAPWPILTATAIAAIALLILHHRRHSMTPTTLRAAADLALLTPLLLLPFLK